MLPDRVSNPGPLTYKSGALPIALRGPARDVQCLVTGAARGHHSCLTVIIFCFFLGFFVLFCSTTHMCSFGPV